MKTHNLNALCSSRVWRSTALWCVGLLIIAFSDRCFVRSLYAQNGLTGGRATKLAQVAATTSEVKTLGTNDAVPQSRITNSPGATIEQVHLSVAGQKTQVRVDGTGLLTYNIFRLNQPDRLVVDFSGAVLRAQERSLLSSIYPVRLVRIGQFQPNVARLVIEIAKQLPYTIAESKNAITVVFNSVAKVESDTRTEKEISTLTAAAPPEPVPSASTQSTEIRLEARSPSDTSMQTAIAPLSDLRDDTSVQDAESNDVQIQVQPAASELQPQTEEKISSRLLVAAYSASPSPAIAVTQTISGYVLGADDEIEIRGIETPEISDKPDKPVLIGTNGDITLPLVGRVKAGGLTVEQLEAALNTRFKQFIKEPQISVTVTEFRSQPVSVFGAVTKPGIIQLRGRQTLYEVLSMAGGPRETAGSILTVTRLGHSGEIPLPDAKLDPTGQFTSAELNMQDILKGKNPAANIEIKPYDIISVSEASSNMIYVVGDVQRAGAFTLGGQRTISVLKAVSLAGGLGHTAKSDKARVIHEVGGGSSPIETAVNIQEILSGKKKDIELGPDDVLVVPTSSRKSFTTSFIPATVSTAVSAAIYHF
jgi:polysaccharide export outer membrane protein